MDRVKLKNEAKNLVQNNLLKIWKILIIALGISISFSIILKIIFPKMDNYVDIFLNLLLIPLQIGVTNFFISFCENEDFLVNDLFKHYKNFAKIICTMFISSILIFLGLTIFIVPGIILALSYSLVPYILIKKPELGILETLKYSRKMMDGHKIDAFILGLSFIGWTILSMFTLGLLYIWLFPYMMVTFTKFYLNILKEG